MLIEGKQIGKGLIYIEDLHQTFTKEYIETLDEDQFGMLLSFCDEKELDRFYNLTLSFKCCYKSAQVLLTMSNC